MLSLNSFSQIDTTRISLQSNIARLVAKDLIRYDGCLQELELTQQKVIKLEEREIQKDTIIKLYSEKDENSQYIIHQYELQVGQYEHMTSDLRDEIRKGRTKTFLYKVGTLIGILTTSYLLIVK
jgi:hypothetical protein